MSMIVALDSELLVLFVVGATNRKYIAKHGRLHPKYRELDFDLLLKVLEITDEIVFTPHTLAEASNHLEQKIQDPHKSEVMSHFRALMGCIREINVNSHEAAGRAEFLRLGLTDSVVLSVAERDVSILTADLDLYLAAAKAGYKALNFNHIRDYGLSA
jgi:hypothetical protein